MGRPTKNLQERVRDGSFLARRHGGLLLGPLVQQKRLREIQLAYRATSSDAERRELALEFQRGVGRDEDDVVGSLVLPELSTPEFFRRYFKHTKGAKAGQPFVLEGFQREFVEEFERRDRAGRRIYRTGLLGLPRGCGKSPLSAGLAIKELCMQLDSPDVFVAAGARDQARTTFNFARSFVESGELADVIQVGRNELVYPEHLGSMRVLSADGALQHGLSVSAAIVDELWAFTSARQEELVTALLTALHKRIDSFLLSITTAGSDKGTLLGRMYTAALAQLEIEHPSDCLTVGSDEESGTLLWWYAAPEDAAIDDEGVWRHCNPASWVDLAELRKQRKSPSMTQATFRRLHLNQWAAAEREQWIKPELWGELAEPGSRIAEGALACLGADGSRTYDCTAVAIAAPAADGRIDVTVRVFSVREGVPAHVFHPGGKIDYEDVEAYMLDCFDLYDVRQAAYDPAYLERSIEIVDRRLSEGAIFPVAPHSRHMREALASFERGVIEGLVRHDGDSVLADHLEWATAERGYNGELRRVRKIDQARPIDAAIAASLAYWRATTVDDARSVYEERGVLVV